MNNNDKNRNLLLPQIEIREDMIRKERACISIVSLAVKMRPMLLASMLFIGIHPLQTIADGNVTLWNKLGSDTEINNSEIGPGGQKNFGNFTPGPFPNFGQAFMNNTPTSLTYALTFPANPVVSKSKGTVAFWAKLNNFPSALFDFVTPLSSVQTNFPIFGWRIGFGSNNGCGGFGFYGSFGVATNAFCNGIVDTATQSGNLDSILGDHSAWHHYAMVWNETGITQLGGRKVYLYIDGILKTTPRYHDGSPWGVIPNGSRIALAYFQNIAGASVAVDNLVVWDDVKTDFSDRFNENPVSQAFSAFNPRASLKTGAKPNDDAFKVLAKFNLGENSDGIDPLNENVTLKLGNFAITIPAGKFEQYGSDYRFEGIINKINLSAEIHMAKGHSKYGWHGHDDFDYLFKLRAKNTTLNGLSVMLPPSLQLTVGDDMGQAKLDTGEAKFGKGRDGEHWLSEDD